ncbi:MAG: hypothetical protein FWE32_10020 [Oscillospiraceae bacterium]|nr:hypothetical protein [Oscillospiraceae bacterium]
MPTKNLIIYYSYTGSTAKIAKKLAEKRGSDLCEVRERKRPGKLAAFTLGGLASLAGRRWEIEPITAEPESYSHITIMAPIWAGKPAPAINTVFDLLPPGKKIEVVMVSGSGKCACGKKVEETLLAGGATLVNLKSVRGSLASELEE